MTVRIKDLAVRAGVPLASVSYVLNHKCRHSISAETSQRVWEATDELDYHANAHAQRLARRGSSAVGLIVPGITDPFGQDVVRGFESDASDRELRLLLRNTECEPERM